MKEVVHLAQAEDLVSLAEFVELWWALEPADVRVQPEFSEQKQALIRMLCRKPDRRAFPEPEEVRGRARLFRLGELADWMAEVDGNDVDELVGSRSEAVDPIWHFHRALEAVRKAFGSAADARRLAMAIAAVMSTLGPDVVMDLADLSADGASPLSALRNSASAVEEGHPELTGVVGALLKGLSGRNEAVRRLMTTFVTLEGTGSSTGSLVEEMLDRLPAGEATNGGTVVTSSSLAQMMEVAGSPQAGESVLDLAAGEGNLLLHVARSGIPDLVLAGYEEDETIWAMAKARFSIHGIAAEFHHARTLDAPKDQVVPTADLVLVDPPLVTRISYRHWLAKAVECTNPAGRAVVVLPSISIHPGRKEWAHAGEEHASIVIAAPNRLRSDRGEGLVLWVLDAGKEVGSEVLLVDATDFGRRVDGANRIEPDELAELQSVVRGWRNHTPVTIAGLPTFVVKRESVATTCSDTLGITTPKDDDGILSTRNDVNALKSFSRRSRIRKADGGSAPPPPPQNVVLVDETTMADLQQCKEHLDTLAALFGGPIGQLFKSSERDEVTHLRGQIETILAHVEVPPAASKDP